MGSSSELGSFECALKRAHQEEASEATSEGHGSLDSTLPFDVVASILEKLDAASLPAAAACSRLLRSGADAAAAALLAAEAPSLVFLLSPPLARPLRLYVGLTANFLRDGVGRGTAWEATKGAHDSTACVSWEHVPPSPRPPAPAAPPAPRPPSRLASLLRRRLWSRSQPVGGGAAATRGVLLCSGHAWGEAAQVIDMPSELRSRGLPAAAAARVLDSGLALRLTLWVRADGGGCSGCGGSSPRGSVLPRRSSDASDGSWERGLRDGGAGSSSSAISRSDSGGSDETVTTAAVEEAATADPGPSADVAFGIMLDDGSSDLRSFGCFVRRASSHQFYSGRLPIASDGEWRRLEHVVSPCPPGFRRAVVLLRGRGAPGGRQSAVRFGSIELTFGLGGAE